MYIYVYMYMLILDVLMQSRCISVRSWSSFSPRVPATTILAACQDNCFSQNEKKPAEMWTFHEESKDEIAMPPGRPRATYQIWF